MGPMEQQLISAEAGALLIDVVPLIVILIGYAYYGGSLLSLDRYRFMQTLEQGLISQAQAADKKTIIWLYMSNWPATITLLLSDGIVVWRACSLFQQDRFWRLVLVVLMIANIGINVADCIWSDLHPNFQYKATILDWLSLVLSLVVNMVATILFACKAWKHHWYIAGLIGGLTHKVTRAENILNLLIESGAIFCAIQCINIIITVLDAYNVIASSWPPEIIQAIAAVAFAWYPVAVIILAPRIQNGNTSYYMDSKGWR
ncbi:hypothetical protein BDP27DRAFT_1405225 [Rhodocollybia butyracea]|uniref:Uncharacterized protein n=1 Tax=Rhodocollybia butyracea TaxID=206335 RepID=A0A9P5PME9_9AGAR|nr:hypothetical protein BDP27DRAFT_1405225 [Rhodocollybia butyracea]